MMYQIIPHKRVTRFLKKHPELARQFIDKAEIMEFDPFDKRLDIKQIEENFYRLRIGKYRFLYIIQDNELIIFVVDVDSRGDIYKSHRLAI